MKLEIFPHLFTRYGSLPVNQFNQMVFIDGDKYHFKWIEVLKNKKNCTDKLCNLIFELIHKEQDEIQRKALLNLKRAIFNDRNNIGNLIQKLPPCLYEKVKDDLLSFSQCKEEVLIFFKNWETVYNEAVALNRDVIKALISCYAFQNGVLLSSKALYQELEGFIKTSSSDIDKRMWRTEFSLLRYLTRMTYKTSPFSTLTYLGLTTLSQNNSKSIIQPAGKVHSNIRLNNKLLKRIKGLMEGHHSLNKLMHVSLNSSVRIEGGKLNYLMNCVNIEIFQKIQATPINMLIYNLLYGDDKQISLGIFSKQLSDQINADPEEIKVFLLKLVDAGMLELTLRCSEINPDWENKLLNFLQPHLTTNDAASLLFEMIKELQDVKDQFSQADVHKRNLLLAQVAHRLDQTFAILEKQAGFSNQTSEELKELTEKIAEKYRNGLGFEKLPYIPFDYRQESIFYEDTCIRKTGSLPDGAIRSITEKLNNLCDQLSAFDISTPEIESMLDFFKKTYSTADRIPVIDFYQAYYKDKESKPVGETSKEKNVQRINPLKEGLKNCTLDENGIFISYDNLALLCPERNLVKAYSVFIQFFRSAENNNIQGVVNGLMPGMGKLNGRFLHLFDTDITVSQQKSNLSLFPDSIMMELNDGSSFNANIHPPLLNHEIKMPASNTIMDRSDQIDINSISLAYHALNDKLILIHKQTGKEIYAFDLCLETLTNRSNLYQMLSHFNPIPRISYYPLINAVDEYYQKEIDSGISINKRITYERDIVLRRKGWTIEKSTIPAQQIDETEGIYYLKIKQWIQLHQIPEDVFIFLKSPYLPKAEDLTTRDDYKPQYICFNQPLLVKLFKRLMQRAGTHVYLEEVLPIAGYSGDTSYRVSEHLLQWHEK